MFVNWKEMFVNWEANLFWLILGSLVTFLITWIYGRSSRKSHKETQRLLDLVLVVSIFLCEFIKEGQIQAYFADWVGPPVQFHF
jgi:hypothetical protein